VREGRRVLRRLNAERGEVLGAQFEGASTVHRRRRPVAGDTDLVRVAELGIRGSEAREVLHGSLERGGGFKPSRSVPEALHHAVAKTLLEKRGARREANGKIGGHAR